MLLANFFLLYLSRYFLSLPRYFYLFLYLFHWPSKHTKSNHQMLTPNHSGINSFFSGYFPHTAMIAVCMDDVACKINMYR